MSVEAMWDGRTVGIGWKADDVICKDLGLD